MVEPSDLIPIGCSGGSLVHHCVTREALTARIATLEAALNAAKGSFVEIATNDAPGGMTLISYATNGIIEVRTALERKPT